MSSNVVTILLIVALASCCILPMMFMRHRNKPSPQKSETNPDREIKPDPD
jgi:hypothetical protein